MVNLANLDLNLLRTLDMLLAEHNVTRTAQRLHLSQPAVSVHLAKLREIFNDPLLLPDSRGMKPTTFADELRQPLRQALEALEKAVLFSVPFEPVQAQQIWRLAASDYSEFTIIQPAMKSLFLQAPQSRIAVVQMSPKRLVRQSERGEIDLAFHIRDNAPPELRSRTLFTEHYVLVGRVGHPILRESVSLYDFCRLNHVIVSPDGGGFTGPTDKALHSLGLQRNVVLSVPHFHFVVSVLKTSDLVAMLPARLVQDQDGLQIVSSPITLPTFDIVMLWHERSHRNPAHKWLREQIMQVC